MYDVEESDDMDIDRLEVINTSNVNSQDAIVLNDERLLELISFYPFLYNRRVRPYKDEDYDQWAWQNIATSFNRSYENAEQSVLPFTVPELQHRWLFLQPIIKRLSRAYDINALPESLRQLVVKISIQLDDQTTELRPKPITAAQSLILSNIPMVEELSMADRRRLEAEVMDLILTAELESKGTARNCTTTVEQEYEDFLKAIRLKELFVMEAKEAELDTIVLDTDTENTNMSGEADVEDMILPDTLPSSVTEQKAEAAKVKEETSDMLLEPLPSRRWVPLKQAHFYVRPCQVRLKRICLDDYLPLSIIKREKTW